MKDYYQILGVSRTASGDEIKRAYRRLALKWHPDRWVTGSEQQKKTADARFKEINEAHSVLSDPDKRKEYDLELWVFERQAPPKPPESGAGYSGGSTGGTGSGGSKSSGSAGGTSSGRTSAGGQTRGTNTGHTSSGSTSGGSGYGGSNTGGRSAGANNGHTSSGGTSGGSGYGGSSTGGRSTGSNTGRTSTGSSSTGSGTGRTSSGGTSGSAGTRGPSSGGNSGGSYTGHYGNTTPRGSSTSDDRGKNPGKDPDGGKFWQIFVWIVAVAMILVIVFLSVIPREERDNGSQPKGDRDTIEVIYELEPEKPAPPVITIDHTKEINEQSARIEAQLKALQKKKDRDGADKLNPDLIQDVRDKINMLQGLDKESAEMYRNRLNEIING